MSTTICTSHTLAAWTPLHNRNSGVANLWAEALESHLQARMVNVVFADGCTLFNLFNLGSDRCQLSRVAADPSIMLALTAVSSQLQALSAVPAELPTTQADITATKEHAIDKKMLDDAVAPLTKGFAVLNATTSRHTSELAAVRARV